MARADVEGQGKAEMHSDWPDIRGRVSRLAARRGSRKVYGEGAHEWILKAPLSTDELRELEGQLRVELPGEYRSFLLEVSRGGAGPWSGLLAPYCEAGRWRWEDFVPVELEPLEQPFPHTSAFNPIDLLPPQPEEDSFESEDAWLLAQRAYLVMYNEESERPEHTAGLLYLSSYGCGHYEVLVVSGPSRGQMWFDGRAGDEGFFPLTDADGARIGFAQWYRRWLEEAETRRSTPLKR